MNYEEVTGIDIANNIRAERNRVGLSQEEVARKIGFTLRTYVKYEDNAKGLKATTLSELADIFGCTISDFYLKRKSTKRE